VYNSVVLAITVCYLTDGFAQTTSPLQWACPIKSLTTKPAITPQTCYNGLPYSKLSI